MAQIITPSGIADCQIDKAGETLCVVFCKTLREHCYEFDSDAVQQVLDNSALGPKLLAVFRQMYEAVSGLLIIRHVKQVDRTRTPQQMLDALGRLQYTNREVVDAMPRSQGQQSDICFWPVGRDTSDDDLEAEYQSYGWVAADPYLAAQANKDDSAFADEHPNFAHWKDASGKWCYLAYYQLGGERHVDVRRYSRGRGWRDHWCVAVVRKESLDS